MSLTIQKRVTTAVLQFSFLMFMCTVFLTEAQAQNNDISLLRKLNVERNNQLDPSLKFMSQSTYALSMAIPTTVYGIGLIKRDSAIRRKGLYIGGSMAVATALTLGMKYTINRERPYKTYPDIINLTNETSPAFPSGHTSLAFATATSFTFAYPKWYVAIPSFAWASSVGYSRMHLGVHYPSDVVVGALVGAGSAWLSCWLSKQFFEKYDHKMSLRKGRRASAQ